MQLELTLEVGKDPIVIDKDSNRDVTHQVAEIRILPGMHAKAKLLDRLDSRAFYVDKRSNNITAFGGWFPVTRISGIWVGKSE